MHHAGWFDVLRDAFPVECCFLIAKRHDGSICGVLPQYISRSRLFGAHLSSLEDGLLADDADVARELLNRAIEERDRAKVRYVVLRGVENGADLGTTPAIVRPTIRRTVDTTLSADDLFRSLDRRVRREIARAETASYRVFIDADLRHIDGVFYDEYAAHVHQLGTPVAGRQMLRAMKARFGTKYLRLYLIAAPDGEIAGGILGIISKAGFNGWYGVVRARDKADFATYLLYWRIIEDLARSGIRTFDLGRSFPGSGSYGFKRKWPGVDRPSDHAFFPRPGVDLTTEAALFETLSLKQRVWRRLPRNVANVCGPLIRRQLPFG